MPVLVFSKLLNANNRVREIEINLKTEEMREKFRKKILYSLLNWKPKCLRKCTSKNSTTPFSLLSPLQSTVSSACQVCTHWCLCPALCSIGHSLLWQSLRNSPFNMGNTNVSIIEPTFFLTPPPGTTLSCHLDSNVDIALDGGLLIHNSISCLCKYCHFYL